MKGIIVMVLLLAGYSLIYAGLSNFTQGITFAEGGAGATPLCPPRRTRA